MDLKLTCSSSGENLSVWAEGAVQDTGLVGWDLSTLDQAWIRPHAKLVVWESVGGNNLLVRGGPSQARDLRAGINGVDTSAGGGVPEVDVLIKGTTTSREEVVLPWTPSKSFDSGLVVSLGKARSVQSAGIPDVDQVVVATGSELGTIGAPLKSANLRGMRHKRSDLVISNADIVVDDFT